MNDEVRQIQEETFRRILLGITVIALVAAGITFFVGGVSSPWFIRALALLAVAGVAFFVRLFGRLVVASYVLVLQLVGLVAEMFLLPGAVTSFIPYLLIPVVVIAGFLLSPVATLVIAAGSIIVILLILLSTGQFTPSNLLLLLPPFSLTILVAFLVAESKRYLTLLGDRLLEDRIMLKQRTLEMMETAGRVENLQEELARLKTEARQAKRELKQVDWSAAQKYDQLYSLVEGAIQELDTAIKLLEEDIEELGDLPGNTNYTKLVETAWQKLYRLKAMMINLEEVSQIEHNKVRLEYHSIDVEQLISESVGAARGLARNKENLEVRYQISDNLPPLQADPIRLRQALQHVLNNAVKFTDRGIVEVQAEMNDKNEMLIFVSDTGIGMHREETDIIFKKFGRGSGPMAQQRQGAGLGLSISKQLVELHGGRMWVTSVLGVGSTFYMALPVEPTAKVDLAKTFTSLPTVQPALSGLTMPRPVSSMAAETNEPEDDTTSIVPAPTAALSASALPAAATSQAISVPASTPAETAEDENGATLVMSPPSASLAAALPLTTPQAILAPPLKEPEDDGATLVLKPSSTVAGDEDTLILPKKKPVQTGAFAHPIRRFGPIYRRRFGLVLIGILLVVTIVVIILAALNGPVEQQMNATATAVAAAKAVAAVTEQAAQESILPTVTPQSENAAANVPASTLSPTPQPTHTPLPTQTLLPVASLTAPPAPTNPPTDTPTPLPSPSPTQVPATGTPTQTPAAISTVSQIPNIPVAIGQSSGVGLPQLTFFAGQLKNRDASDFAAGKNSDTALETTENSRASWSPGGQLLFAGEQNGNRDIYATGNDDQSTRLTTTAGDDWQPDWSPDGKKVAFSSNRGGNFEIYTMDADGSNLTQLTDSRGFDEWPVWSPDGDKIAFVSDRDGDVNIYTMNADGGSLQQITTHPADDWPATWSPDGTRLVFASEREGNWNLYITLTGGGPVARLTNAPGAERDPIWLPDENIIAFAYNNGTNWDIYTMPAPNGSISEIPLSKWTQVTDTPTDERYPTWSQPSK